MTCIFNVAAIYGADCKFSDYTLQNQFFNNGDFHPRYATSMCYPQNSISLIQRFRQGNILLQTKNLVRDEAFLIILTGKLKPCLRNIFKIQTSRNAGQTPSNLQFEPKLQYLGTLPKCARYCVINCIINLSKCIRNIDIRHEVRNYCPAVIIRLVVLSTTSYHVFLAQSLVCLLSQKGTFKSQSNILEGAFCKNS